MLDLSHNQTSQTIHCWSHHLLYHHHIYIQKYVATIIKSWSHPDKPNLVPRIRTNADHWLAWRCSHYITGFQKDHNSNLPEALNHYHKSLSAYDHYNSWKPLGLLCVSVALSQAPKKIIMCLSWYHYNNFLGSKYQLYAYHRITGSQGQSDNFSEPKLCFLKWFFSIANSCHLQIIVALTAPKVVASNQVVSCPTRWNVSPPR